MEREKLEQMYEDGDLNNPDELQRLRDEIHTYTGLRVPRSVSDIEEWWSDNKAVFARRIKPTDMSIEESELESNEGDNE